MDTAGSITDVAAVHLTDAPGRSVRIRDSAAPILRSGALTAQSAEGTAVHGATDTGDTYLSSLQWAIDLARDR